jgi:hypothetical protein
VAKKLKIKSFNRNSFILTVGGDGSYFEPLYNGSTESRYFSHLADIIKMTIGNPASIVHFFAVGH